MGRYNNNKQIIISRKKNDCSLQLIKAGLVVPVRFSVQENSKYRQATWAGSCFQYQSAFQFFLRKEVWYGRWTDQQLMEYNARAIAMIPADEGRRREEIVRLGKKWDALRNMPCPLPRHVLNY